MPGQAYPQDSINEYIISKVESVSFTTNNIKFKSRKWRKSFMRNELLIFYDNLSVFGQNEKSLNG